MFEVSKPRRMSMQSAALCSSVSSRRRRRAYGVMTSSSCGGERVEENCRWRWMANRHRRRGRKDDGGRWASQMACRASESQEEIECFGVGAETECIVPAVREDSGGGTAVDASEERGGRSRESDLPSSSLASSSPLILLSPFFCWGTAMVAMKCTPDDYPRSCVCVCVYREREKGDEMHELRDTRTWRPVRENADTVISHASFGFSIHVAVVPKAAPFFVAAHRLVPAGIILLVFRAVSSKKGASTIVPTTSTAWLAILVFALIDATMFQGFLATGLETTGAGLGSVIIDSQPITVFILASIFLNEKITSRKVTGLAAGVAGLLLLEVEPGSVQATMAASGDSGAGENVASLVTNIASFASNFDLDITRNGELAMLLAAQSMAVGTVLIRWVSKHADPVAATGWHLLLGGLPLAALSIIYEDGLHIYSRLDELDFLALLYTSVFGCAVGYGIFFKLASAGSLTRLSSLTFTTPIFASLFGYVLLGETLSSVQIAGAAVTLVGVSLIV